MEMLERTRNGEAICKLLGAKDSVPRNFMVPNSIICESEETEHSQSDMERQRQRFGLNRPEGVNIKTPGGFSGYSLGNMSLPQKYPPSKAVSLGPSTT